jgi:dTDP-4-dehydrorhamnose reductase
MLESVKPDIVIHCAAITDLSYCIKYPDRAQKLHVDASAVLASFPSVEKMVYISTDSVFKGTKGYYSEEEITNPLNIYATTKRDGELAVMNESNQGYIIRTNIIGYKEPLGNSLFEWAYKEVSNGHSINGFTNVLFNPLYTGLLAGMLIEFLQSVASPGYYHFASDTPVSKYTFLQKVAEALGFHQAFISPVELDNSLYEVQRPLNTSLCTKKLAGIGISIPDIDQCIYELVKDFKMSSDNGERI